MSPSQLRGVLARNIRQQAKKRGLALNSLADFAGVSRSHLYAALKSKKAISTDVLAKLAKALEVPPWQLLVP